MAEVWEVATFYFHFDAIRKDEAAPPDLTIRVCESLSCELAKSEALFTALQTGHNPARIRVLRAPCMGRCDTAPGLEIGHLHVDHATVEAAQTVIDAGDFYAVIPAYETLASYRNAGGYQTLQTLRDGGDVEQVQDRACRSQACADLAARAFPRVANGLSFGPILDRAIWP